MATAHTHKAINPSGYAADIAVAAQGAAGRLRWHDGPLLRTLGAGPTPNDKGMTIGSVGSRWVGARSGAVRDWLIAHAASSTRA